MGAGALAVAGPTWSSFELSASTRHGWTGSGVASLGEGLGAFVVPRALAETDVARLADLPQGGVSGQCRARVNEVCHLASPA